MFHATKCAEKWNVARRFIQRYSLSVMVLLPVSLFGCFSVVNTAACFQGTTLLRWPPDTNNDGELVALRTGSMAQF